MHIPPYLQAVGFGSHDPDRKRKLLVHRDQIDELVGQTQQQSLTLVPLSIYFKDGRAKVELALARGRRLYDKRHAIASREADRDAARDIARAMGARRLALTRRLTAQLSQDVLAGHLVVVRAARMLLHRGDEVIEGVVTFDVERDPARACRDAGRLQKESPRNPV